jgi:hypothetical protein
MYAPLPPQLLCVRTHIAETWPEIHSIVRRPAFTRHVGALDGERTTRVPRGFAADHPAAGYLKYRQFLAGREFAADLACSDEFYPTLVRVFKAVVPLVRFLNTGMTTREPRTLNLARLRQGSGGSAGALRAEAETLNLEP